MSRMPRILPLTVVAIGGVLAINAITRGPDLLSAAKAFAEDAAKPGVSAKPAVSPDATVASVAPAAKPAPVCAPTAAELAKEAGLSPAELQVLQSLTNRRGQLDQRESDLDTQVQLIAAAEAKLDSRIKEMNGLKSDIQGLLTQADQQQAAETGRLVKIYEAMDPKAAAARMATMDDGVRLPIAAKMKERILAQVLGKMDPDAARILTEKLAHRIDQSQSIANARSALNPPANPSATAKSQPTKTAQAATPAPDAAAAPADGQDAAKPATPKPHRVARAKPHPKPAGTQVAAVKPAVPPTASPNPAPAPAKPAPSAPASATPAPPAAKTG